MTVYKKKSVEVNFNTLAAFPIWQQLEQGGSWVPAVLFDFIGVTQALFIMDTL